MIVKIPSKFIDDMNGTIVRDVYINTNNVQLIDVSKQVQQVWDRDKKEFKDEYESIYNVQIQMDSNYVYLKPFNESLFIQFKEWFNKSMYLEKLSD